MMSGPEGTVPKDPQRLERYLCSKGTTSGRHS